MNNVKQFMAAQVDHIKRRQVSHSLVCQVLDGLTLVESQQRRQDAVLEITLQPLIVPVTLVYPFGGCSCCLYHSKQGITSLIGMIDHSMLL